ncbi:NUDIX hydrolase [Patescibacteria group bacterium]|nr:NUDIX hydrolase [Patescibacteria group bacterium]
MTTVSGKLKPGSKAWISAKAAAKAEKAKASIAAVKVARKKKAVAATAHSLAVKIGMTKKKYGITDEMIFYPGGGKEPDFLIEGAEAWVKAQGLKVSDIEWLSFSKAAKARKVLEPTKPTLQAQAEVLSEMVAAKKATKALTDDAAKAVKAWSGTGPVAEVLDHADYRLVPGWEQLPAGSVKRQSYGVVLFDDQGRVLLREPTDHFGGTHWTFAKGGGWPPGSTALKELGEETGYIATIHDILPGKFKGTQTQTNYFLGKSSGFDPGLMDLETAGTKWMTYDEALAAIAQSKSATVVARDTAVLQAAYKHLSGGDPKLFAGVVSSGKDSLDAAKAVAAKAAHSHRVKLDMAQKHFAKPKFGGGVVDADWVNPGTKQKLNVDGLNKVLSEKGWHLTTLPKDVSTDLLGVADDVVTQKAIIDGLKKAPKTVPKPPAAKPTPKPHPALVSADEFTGDLHDDVAEALSKGHLHPDDVDYLDLSDTLMEWAEEKKLAPGWLDDFDHGMLAEHFNMFKKAHPNLYGKIDDIPAPRFPSGEEIEDIMGWTRPRAALPATVWDEKDFFKSGKLKKGAIYDKLKGHGLSDTQAADLTDKFIATSPKTYALPGQAAEAFDEFLEEPLVLAKMGKLPGAPPTAPILTETIEVPLERDLKKVANLPGSTKPWKAKDKAGKHWVVKDVSGSKIDPDHLRSEGLADELYRRLGIAVPKGKIINAPGGPMKITEFLEGGQTLAEWKVGKSVVKIKEMYAQIRKGAVADALFANHYVGGLSFDNIMVVGGKAYRIDNGGALLYRAQGGMKRTWKNKVTDLATMRDPKHNEVTAAIFEDLTDDEIHQQIRYIVAHKQDVLAAIVDDGLRGTMAARIDDLASRLPSRPAVRRPRAVPVGKRRAEYGNTPDAAPRAKAAKSNGVNLAGDKNDIEDDNILVWEQLGRDNKPQTRVQLKVTHEGSEKVKATLGDELERAQRAAAPTVTNPNVHPDDAYWDVVLAGAKTVSIHAGDGKFNTTILDKFAKAKEQVVKKLKTATGDKKKMLKHYAVAIDEIETAKRTGKTLPKGLLSQYVHKPKPKAAVPQPRRRDMRVRRDSGIDFPTADFKNGTGRVNTGHNNFSSEAYIIDMGDAAEGVEVKFLPNDGGFNQAKGRAMHGTISITVDGEVTQERIDDALSILKNLGLDIAPPPPAFEEALYIHRGVYLRGKHTSSGYKTIWENKSITDEEKVTQLKKWVKKNMQVDLDKVAQYDPAGVASNADGSGFRHWMRWDLSEDDVRREMSDYTIQHTTKGLSESPTGAVSKTLANILDSGGEFTSTTGRIRKGVSVGLTGGASSSSDINSGGGSYFFTRIKKVASVQAHGFFFRPSLLARQDPISYSSDTFGSISALHKRASTIEQFKAYARNSGNETIFKEGLSLADLDYIRIRPDERASVLKVFKDRGITTLPDGRPVEDIVITTKAPKKRNL